MPAEQFEEPMARILLAQAKNIARIVTDLELEGTSGIGQAVKLWGPAPDLIRIYDTPLRLVQERILENWERLITLMPLSSPSEGQIVGRNDRTFAYQVSFMVRLTPSEQAEDARKIVEGSPPGNPSNLRDHHPLLHKAHRLIWDFHHVFYDDLHLHIGEEPGCRSGLVGQHSYAMNWDAEIEYPQAMFMAECTGLREGW